MSVTSTVGIGHRLQVMDRVCTNDSYIEPSTTLIYTLPTTMQQQPILVLALRKSYFPPLVAAICIQVGAVGIARAVEEATFTSHSGKDTHISNYLNFRFGTMRLSEHYDPGKQRSLITTTSTSHKSETEPHLCSRAWILPVKGVQNPCATLSHCLAALCEKPLFIRKCSKRRFQLSYRSGRP